MSEWFTAAELVGLPGLPGTDRGVRKAAARDEWRAQKRAAGKGQEYHISSLPPEAAAALVKKHAPAKPVAATATPVVVEFTYDRNNLWEVYDRKSDKQKEKAKAKLALLQQVMELRRHGVQLQDAFKAVGDQSGTSWRTMEGWYHGRAGRPGIKLYAPSDWLAALVQSYAGRQKTADCDPQAWEFFKADYLRLERPGARACYERLQQAATEHGWTIPALRTLERRIKNEIPAAALVRAREGELAMQALFPSQQRTVRDMYALEWINGDGYQHNVFIEWPDGSIARPKTWVWQDVYSRKILAWRTDLSEHTDVIRLSFGDLVEKYGLPDHATIDNTRAAANKWMTGGIPWRNRYKVRQDDVLGLFPQLGVQVHWTSLNQTASGKNSGHGQAKPVERAFGWGGLGEYVDKRLEFAGAWCGDNPTAKPENYATAAVPLETFLAGLADSIASWNARQGRRTEICAGQLSYDQAFEQSFKQALIRQPTAAQRRLWLLPAEARRVQRDGSLSLDAGSAPGAPKNRYWDEALLPHIGQKLVVRFDPDHLHNNVHVYTLDGHYIGEAGCHAPVGYGDTQAGREHNKARTQWKKAVREQLKAEQKMDALEAAKLLPESEEAEVPTTSVPRLFKPTPITGQAALAIQPEDDMEELQNNFAANIAALAKARDNEL